MDPALVRVMSGYMVSMMLDWTEMWPSDCVHQHATAEPYIRFLVQALVTLPSLCTSVTGVRLMGPMAPVYECAAEVCDSADACKSRADSVGFETGMPMPETGGRGLLSPCARVRECQGLSPLVLPLHHSLGRKTPASPFNVTDCRYV